MIKKERIRKQRVQDGFSRVYDSEKIVSLSLLNGYTARGSRGEKLIEDITGCSINQLHRHSITRMAEFFSILIDKNFPRNYRRRKELIVKWFDDYEEEIIPYLSCISFSFIEEC